MVVAVCVGAGGGTVPLQKRATTVHGQVTEVAT